MSRRAPRCYCSPEVTDGSLLDCGMIHFRDADVKKALLEVNPDAKELVEFLKFGEITNG